MKSSAIKLGRMRILPVPPSYWDSVLFEPTGSGAVKVRIPGYRHYARVRAGQREALLTGFIPSWPMDELVLAQLVPSEQEALKRARVWLQLVAWKVVFMN